MMEKRNLVLLIFKGPCCPHPGIPIICCMTPGAQQVYPGIKWFFSFLQQEQTEAAQKGMQSDTSAASEGLPLSS